MQPRRRRGAPLALLLVALATMGGLLAACALPDPSAGPPGSPPPSGPAAGASQGAAPSASMPSRPYRPTPTPAPTFASYVVRAGDTLIALARRFGTTPESLAYWNRARYPSLDPESSAYRPGRIDVGWTLAYLPGEVVDPENLPPASAGPTGGAGSAGPVGPYPTLPADGSAALVHRGPTGLDAVALTFDYGGGAGAGPGGADAVVQWLEANAVPATVFVGNGAAAPGDAAAAAVLARLRAATTVRAGLLADVGKPAGLGAALRAADTTLAAAVGRSTAPWLRPAGGAATAAALQEAGGAGWTWAIAWDVDPGDAVAPGAGGPIATDIVARVVSRARGGSIVRLQLGGARTLDALPGILDALASAGLRVASLDEVLGRTVEE